MNPFAGNSKLATYHSISVHGGVSEAEPHTLVLMLMNALKERIATARGCIERRETAHQAKLLHNCVLIVAELRGSLNMSEGGALAHNLSNLYEYMINQLVLANAKSDPARLREVAQLLEEIRTAWIAIGPQARKQAGA